MIQISTTSNSSKCIQNECASESLSEEDEILFSSFKSGLNEIIREPQSKSVEYILSYSKTIKPGIFK